MLACGVCRTDLKVVDGDLPGATLPVVPGHEIVGRVELTDRLHDELGLETLADLEAAVHDDRLETIAGFGAKRLAGIRDALAHRLGHVRLPELDLEQRRSRAGWAPRETRPQR